jgi:peptidoglycan pentaglycine glycine transferase (the first glycine)
MHNLAFQTLEPLERPALIAVAPSAASAPAAGWDQFVAATPGGDLVQTTVWGRAKEATGFAVTVAASSRGGDIEGGALLVMKRFGPLGSVGYVARGPVIADDDPRQVERVLCELERTAREHRVRHLVIQPPEGGEQIAAALAARGYTADAPDVSPSATIVIDLTASPDTILGRMSSTRRRSVRQALRRGVRVRPGGAQDLDAFHALHLATARRQGFAPLSRAYLQAQWEALRPQGAVEFFMAELEDRPLAGIWNTVFGDTMTYRIPAWSGEEPSLQPNVACHWLAIEWARERGYRRYDLGGSALMRMRSDGAR